MIHENWPQDLVLELLKMLLVGPAAEEALTLAWSSEDQ
jgi:hypothetical protein